MHWCDMAGMKVLVVDDNASMRSMIGRFIELIGVFNIDYAVNGNDAIKQFCEVRHDLIIMDNVMPEKDGLDVLRELKKDPKIYKTYVIFITGTVNQGLIATIHREQLKVDDMLVKPFDYEKFKERFNKIAIRFNRNTKQDGPILKEGIGTSDRRTASRYSEPKLLVKIQQGVFPTVNWSMSAVCISYKETKRLPPSTEIFSKIGAPDRLPAHNVKLTVVHDDLVRGLVVLKFVELGEEFEAYLKSLIS